jgi:hypothetical protein
MNFKISFWNLPVSKDDSFIGLPEAELVHAAVSSSDEKQGKQYIVEPVSEEWRLNLGTIELLRTPDEHWKLVRGKEAVEGIFPRIIQAIEDVETQLKNHPADLSE